MDNAKKLQILEILLAEFLQSEKMRVVSSSEFKRNLGNLSKRTGIPANELREVIEPFIRRAVNNMLAQ